jgi:hypothetical protein
MTYPAVLGEEATLSCVLDGQSLARYGDGEFRLCAELSIKCQTLHTNLSSRLRKILRTSGECLVGIPNIHSATPKAAFWQPQLRFARYLVDRPYVSAFVTRPDSAPWINTDDYWAALQSLWVGQAVTLVRGSSKSLTAEDLVGAADVTEVLAPRQHAWADYEELLERVGRPARALLCVGPTATVMAVDLCQRGVHAIDLGHIGMFLKKHRRGDPMVVTAEDKVA